MKQKNIAQRTQIKHMKTPENMQYFPEKIVESDYCICDSQYSRAAIANFDIKHQNKTSAQRTSE